MNSIERQAAADIFTISSIPNSQAIVEVTPDDVFLATFSAPPAESLPDLALFSKEHQQDMMQKTSDDVPEPVLPSVISILPFE